jgi:flavin-dependent dehydrogenase
MRDVPERLRDRRDVTVVGASVAGLFAAYHLARDGVPVRVYEAQAALDPPPRTLIVTSAWLRLLDFDAEETILNRTRVFELISRSASARIELREPDLVVERDAFVALLSRKVQETGGELVFGHRLERMENHRAAPVLRFSTERGGREIFAPQVLGADGVGSVVAEGTARDELERVALLQVRVPLPADQAPDTVRVWFDRASTRFFYWLIPESPQTGVAGLIADTTEQAEQALKRFLAMHNLVPITYQEDALVPLHPLRFGTDGASRDGRVVLVGDAAGQVKVTTVGGVVTGMRGGLAAARAILRGASYACEVRRLRRELNFHALVRRVLDGFTDEDYDRLLGLLNRKGQRVLCHYNRDELTRAIWRLLPAQPRWLLLGMRALLLGIGGRPLVYRGR